jgi:hypothetical protein
MVARGCVQEAHMRSMHVAARAVRPPFVCCTYLSYTKRQVACSFPSFNENLFVDEVQAF